MKCALCINRPAPEGMTFCDECWNVAGGGELQEAFDAHQDAEMQWAQQLAQCEREHVPQDPKYWPTSVGRRHRDWGAFYSE